MAFQFRSTAFEMEHLSVISYDTTNSFKNLLFNIKISNNKVSPQGNRYVITYLSFLSRNKATNFYGVTITIPIASVVVAGLDRWRRGSYLAPICNICITVSSSGSTFRTGACVCFAGYLLTHRTGAPGASGARPV